ncbi:hypothetical protein GW17_00037128, partial [Ensete ventricosum]
LRGMPRMTGGKAPPSRPTAREVGASPAREAPLKRPAPPPTEQAKVAGKQQKKTKVLTRKHKSHVGKGGSHSRSKGKEPTASPERPEGVLDVGSGRPST